MKMSDKFFKFNQWLLVSFLVLPWGLFLIFAPSNLKEYFGIEHYYWRILGLCSILGAMIYILPLVMPDSRRDFYIYIFAILDNLLAGTVVLTLYLADSITKWALYFVPILFYFATIYLIKHKSFRKPKYVYNELKI